METWLSLSKIHSVLCILQLLPLNNRGIVLLSCCLHSGGVILILSVISSSVILTLMSFHSSPCFSWLLMETRQIIAQCNLITFTVSTTESIIKTDFTNTQTVPFECS